MSEIEQTELLIEQATYPSIKAVLSKHLAALRAAEARSAAAAVASAAAAEVSSTPAPAPASTAVKRTVPACGMYIPIQDFAWEQGGYNSDTVTVFVELPGVGSVQQNVVVNFTKSSFDLIVTDLNGKNYRLVKENLDKDIVPGDSKFVVKANKVVLKLKKVRGEHSFEHWSNLTAKKRRDAQDEVAKKKEPMSGIMDMMKDMYEDGDENMRKIIGEAMMKSQRGEKATPSLDDM